MVSAIYAHYVTGHNRLSTLQVQQVSAKRKLSQDRSAHDQQNVIAALANPFGRDPDTLELETRQQMLKTLRK